MSSVTANAIIEEIIGTIEIPDSAYETAESRFRDLGEWVGRPESKCGPYAPHVHVQGSFRLGTVVRPLGVGKPYDLDLSLRLERGIRKDSHTQEQLKNLVGLDIESYREARRIVSPKKEKTRCWRLEYADSLSFYMDIVPCIPETDVRRRIIEEAMIKAGSDRALARLVSSLTVGITDCRHPNYRVVAPDWNISNPEGYARWWEARMRQAAALLQKRLIEAKATQIDDLPVFRWKTPLQRCVQLLKRHRDIMFATRQDVKPISIIITTLAARAYRGESDLVEALERILTDMEKWIKPGVPRVPNPVDPAEDFADKWSTREGREKRLEDNFKGWLKQAQVDFEVITSSTDTDFISKQAMQKFGVGLDGDRLRKKMGLGIPVVLTAPKSHIIVEPPAKPWRR